MLYFYRIVNWLGADIALGACIGLCFCSSVIGGSKVELPVLIGLGSSVLAIYSFDHWRDSRPRGHSVTGSRLAFYGKNRRLLFVILLIASAISLITALWISNRILFFAIGSGFLVMGYLVLLHVIGLRNTLVKECMVAIVYAIVIAGVSGLSTEYSVVTVLMGGCYFCLALQNITIIHESEKYVDTVNNSHNLVTEYGINRVHILFGLCASLFTACSILAYQLKITGTALLVLWAMEFYLGTIWLCRNYKTIQKNNRPLAEAVFFFPMAYWFCP
jgi:4-hydroxybenzoate polyprenyltransferase